MSDEESAETSSAAAAPSSEDSPRPAPSSSGLSMVQGDADLMQLLAAREGGLRPGSGKRARGAPLPVGGAPSLRRAAQLAVNAIDRALLPIAEREVLQQ